MRKSSRRGEGREAVGEKERCSRGGGREVAGEDEERQQWGEERETVGI